MKRLTVSGTGEARTDVTIKEVLDRLRFYEDYDEREELLIHAFTIETTVLCSECGHSQSAVSETWIRPDLLKCDRFYTTKEEAEKALEQMKKEEKKEYVCEYEF